MSTFGVPQSTDTRRKSSLKLFKNSDFYEISELLFKVPVSSCVTPVPLLSEDLTDGCAEEEDTRTTGSHVQWR